MRENLFFYKSFRLGSRVIMKVLIDRIKVPERGVHRVIERRHIVVREHIRHNSVADISGKCQKDLLSFFETFRAERQTGKGDHCVSAPVSKPRKSGENGHHFRGLAVSQKLVAGKHQLVGKRVAVSGFFKKFCMAAGIFL